MYNQETYSNFNSVIIGHNASVLFCKESDAGRNNEYELIQKLPLCEIREVSHVNFSSSDVQNEKKRCYD
jgi:hypothetical protein